MRFEEFQPGVKVRAIADDPTSGIVKGERPCWKKGDEFVVFSDGGGVMFANDL